MGILSSGTPIWTLPEPLYRRGSPVLIRGVLLEKNGLPFCRLELENLGLYTLRAVTVAVQPLDGEGAPLGPELPWRYAGLSVNRDGRFGARILLPLPVERAASFTARVLRADYAEGESWLCALPFYPLPPERSLEEAYGGPEAAEQFRVRYGSSCRCAPETFKDLWRCSCGALNRQGEGSCHRCRRVLSAQLEVNREALQRESESCLENQKRLEEEDRAGRMRLRRRLLISLGVLIPLLVLTVGLLKAVPPQLERRQQYENAQRMLALGQYDEAAQVFTALGDYADSAQMAGQQIPYARALDLMDRAERNDAASLLLIGRSRSELNEETTAAILLYEAAAELLEPIRDYRDSEELLKQCREGIEAQREGLLLEAYDRACGLLEEGSLSAAREAFLALGDYADSAELALEAVYRKAAALTAFIENNNIRGVYALVSMEPGGVSRFSLSQEKALQLGSHCVADLRRACGEDLSDVSLSDSPGEGLLPIDQCVTQLLESLGDYRDCPELRQRIAQATDYTREFTMLCEAGDLTGAEAWLRAYEGEFENREGWLETLALYEPWCADWVIYLGDATVLPLTMGSAQPCNAFSSRVLIRDGVATLRLSLRDEERPVDLSADLGETDFHLDDGAYYLAAISPVGRFAYMKYGQTGGLVSSCEYQRAQ